MQFHSCVSNAQLLKPLWFPKCKKWKGTLYTAPTAFWISWVWGATCSNDQILMAFWISRLWSKSHNSGFHLSTTSPIPWYWTGGSIKFAHEVSILKNPLKCRVWQVSKLLNTFTCQGNNAPWLHANTSSYNTTLLYLTLGTFSVSCSCVSFVMSFPINQ